MTWKFVMRADGKAEERLRSALALVWNDHPSRWLALIGGACLWFTVTLVEPAFLAPLLAAGGGLWLRRDRRAAAALVEDDDDWF